MSSRKRPFDSLSSQSGLIDIFEDLSSHDENVRLEAAQRLVVNHISDASFRDEAVTRVLKRLLRGVSSGRKAARVGFSVALAGALSQVITNSSNDQHVSEFPQMLFHSLKETTDVNMQSSKQEGRDHYHGQLFGITALIRSGIFFLPGDQTLRIWEEVLDFVMELASKKSWLREECGYMLYTILTDGVFPADSTPFVRIIIAKITSHQWLYTPEGVALWLALQELGQGPLLPAETWYRNNPLHVKEKKRLSKIIVGTDRPSSASDEESAKIVEGRWSPTIHFVWSIIISRLAARPNVVDTLNKPTKQITFDLFWETAVDNILFSPKSSQERKFKGLLLFQHCISSLSAQLVSSLFTPNFLRTIINHLALKDRFLHRASDKARDAMLNRIADDPTTTIPLLKGLLIGLNGEIDFDNRTKTRTVERILLSCIKLDAKDTIRMLAHVTTRIEGQSELEVNVRQLAIANEIVSVFPRLHTISEESKQGAIFIRGALSLLASWAYADQPRMSANPAQNIVSASESSRRQLNARILSCFTHILSQRSDAAHIVFDFFTDLRSHALSINPLRVYGHGHDNLAKLLQKSYQIISNITEMSSRLDSERLFQEAVIVLLGMIQINVFGGDLDSASILEDLLQIFGNQKCQTSSIDDPASFVQILLSLISKPSILLRRTVNQIFPTIAGSLNEEALEGFLTVLDSKEGLSGQATLFSIQDDEREMGESDSYDEDSGSDMTGVSGGNIQIPSAEGKKDPSETKLESGEAEQQEDDQEVIEFEKKVAEALGTGRKRDGEESSDETSSGEDMNDDQMEVVDQSLQSIFSERKKAIDSKQSPKGAKDMMINFKCRVLELLEIYIKAETGSLLCLGLILPLLVLIRSTSSPVVARKACDLVKTYFDMCKGERLLKVVDVSPVIKTLRSVHEEAMTPASNTHLSACSKASLLLVRILASHDKANLQLIIKMYGETQEMAMFDRSRRYKISFFTDWLNWSQTAR